MNLALCRFCIFGHINKYNNHSVNKNLDENEKNLKITENILDANAHFQYASIRIGVVMSWLADLIMRALIG